MLDKNSDPTMMLVQKYKVAIQENKLANEVFKWKVVVYNV